MNQEPKIIFSLAAAILLIGAFAGGLLMIRLMTLRKGPVLANRFLLAIIGIMTILIITAIFFLSQKPGFEMGLLRIPGSLTLSYGPLIYLYIQASIRKDFTFGRGVAAHFIPPFIGFSLITIASVLSKLPPPEFDEPGSPPLPAIIVAMMMLIYVLTYIFLAGRSIFRHRAFVRENSSFTDQLHSQWLLLLFPILLLPFLFVIFTFLFAEPFRGQPYPVIGASLMLTVLHVVMIFFPSVFQGFPDSLQAEKEDDLLPEKYLSSSLEEDQKARIHQQLLRHMEEQKPFLKDDLTLAELAGRLDLNSKYLSQVINERADKHFMDFINTYRVEYAKTLLTDRDYRHYTIVAVAQEAGFRSRSAFYSAFRKVSGQTPSEFKKESIEV